MPCYGKNYKKKKGMKFGYSKQMKDKDYSFGGMDSEYSVFTAEKRGKKLSKKMYM